MCLRVCMGACVCVGVWVSGLTYYDVWSGKRGRGLFYYI